MNRLNSSEPQALPILLASASPRRQELLRQIGVPYRVVRHGVSEDLQESEAAAVYVARLAREKARNVFDQQPAAARPVVLGADTVVVCGDQILGKPRNRADAIQTLTLLSGRAHQVLSAVAVLTRDGCQQALSTTTVEFRRLHSEELEDYWRSGEPRDKAGAYGIQGRAAVFVKRLTGSYSGVMGLPLYETAELLNRVNVPCWQAPGAIDNE